MNRKRPPGLRVKRLWLARASIIESSTLECEERHFSPWTTPFPFSLTRKGGKVQPGKQDFE
jgi:hypothetical protein